MKIVERGVARCKYCGFCLVIDGVRGCCVAGSDYDRLERERKDASNIVTVIDERMGKGWTRDLAHALFPFVKGSTNDAAVDASK